MPLITIEIPAMPGMLPGDPITIEEHAATKGMSLYRLEGGQVAAVMPATHGQPVPFALFLLWRAVANLTRVCPVCAERASLETMAHESDCPLSDAALGDLRRELVSHDLAGDESTYLVDAAERPRRWQVTPPRLAPAVPGARA